MQDSKATFDELGNIELSTLHGVGDKSIALLNKLNINSLQDLLLHIPNRYQNRSHIAPVAVSQGTKVTVSVEIINTVTITRNRRILNCICVANDDSKATLTLIFFHFSEAQRRSLRPGSKLHCFGEIRFGSKGLEMLHPEYNLVGSQVKHKHLTTFYSLTQSLSQIRIRSYINQALSYLNPNISDATDELFEHEGLPGLNLALRLVHQPPVDIDIDLLNNNRHPAQQRLSWEELLASRLSMQQLRNQQLKSPSLHLPTTKLDGFIQKLDFKPTNAQLQVGQEILTDMQKSRPMFRLLQGDVGSGKTLPAAIAILSAVSSNTQAAFMAPTDILARQHAKTLANWDFPVELLVGKSKKKDRKLVLDRLACNANIVVVGTHALFQEQVTFPNLGLIIIDEQHRFGVHQRLLLFERGQHSGFNPHRLVMTATPIPRTLAMSFYSELDYSILDEMPPEKASIKTIAVANDRRDEVIAKVGRACTDGAQAYWVCPLIDTSEVMDISAANEVFESLQQALPETHIGLIHGRLKSTEKEDVLEAFMQGKIQALVATTVIEVGINVPNATIMVIENAERLGLAQLHQLRGRIGRGKKASHCLLLYQKPLTAIARQRIKLIRQTIDGFKIAEKDLKLRGSGEFFGIRQTGTRVFRIADLLLEKDHLHKINSIALKAPRHELRSLLISRWLPNQERFAKA